ncbi:MAG TPA: hypothetical protein DEP45_06990 [Armatimonadetes bacterium]|nr:hypothetical protein [Armatimonadota bacterium]
MENQMLQTLIFSEPGEGNTRATLDHAVQRASALGIEQMVVATSTGRTALEAAEHFGGGRVIAVTLSAGHWERYCPPDPEIIAELRRREVSVLTGTHTLFGGIDGGLSAIGAVSASQVMAHTYYTIGQGTKVAVECALMAADAGLLDMNAEAISIAGTEGGADTALVISPAFSNTCFDLRIREIIVMPR